MNYKQIHDSIIEKAKNSNRTKGDGNYYEAHHIIPQCMGGEGKTHQWKTHPNIVLLTGKEHIIIHRLLCEIYPDNDKLVYGYWRLVNTSRKKDRNYRVSPREYERLKIKQANAASKNMTGKMVGENHPMFGRTGKDHPMFGRTGKDHPMFGVKRSKETIQKQKQNTKVRYGEDNPMFGRTGEKHPLFGIKGENHPLFGSKRTEEQKLKMSGENNPNFGKTGEKNPLFAIKRPEQSIRFSGEGNPNFGNGDKIRGEKNPMKKEENKQKVRGEKNGFFGKGYVQMGEKNPNAKKVICDLTGKIYGCAKDAAKEYGLTTSKLSRWLNNPEKNKSSLRFL